MGTIIKTRCRNCGLEKSLSPGIGFFSVFGEIIDGNDKRTIDKCRNAFSGKTKEQILAAITVKNARLTTFKNIYKCPKCGDYRTEWCMCITIIDSGQKYDSDAPICGLCGSTMEGIGALQGIELEVELDKCPLCGHDNEVQEAGLWD